MDIKDYIHFYLGQNVRFNGMTGTLTAVEKINENIRVSIHVPADRENPEWNVPPELIKPILRPIEGMTDEEIKFVLKIPGFADIYERNNYQDHLEVLYKYKNPIPGDPNDEDYQDTIYSGNGIATRPRYLELSASKLNFMTNNGIDVFGLIDAGLAIEAENTKPLPK